LNFKGWSVDAKSELTLLNSKVKEISKIVNVIHSTKEFGCRKFGIEPKLSESAKEMLE
jgi:hypothetical protein